MAIQALPLKALLTPKTLCLVCYCAAIAFSNTSMAAEGATPSKPNILIFMTDDIGFGDIHALNPQKRESITPNIDKLVETGVSFQHAHSPAAVCAPTRYALLTGNHVYRGRLASGTWSPDLPSQILQGQETLGDRLQENGYRTAFFGKVHLGGVFKNADGEVVRSFTEADLSQKFNDGVSEHGFDYSLSLPSGIQKNPLAFFQNDRMVRYDRTTSEFKPLTREEIDRHFRIITDESEKTKYTTEVPGPLFVMDNYTPESVGPLLMQDALRFLDDHFENYSGKPFYIHYMSQAGHRPYAPPVAFNVDAPLNTEDSSAPGAIRVKGMTPTKRTDMIHEADVALGLFLEKLAAAGQLQNTIIIYTSDNGSEISEQMTWTDPIYDATHAHPWYRGPYGGDRIEFGEYPAHADQTHTNGQGVGLDQQALRGMKSFVYEGGHRVPLIIRWGGGKNTNSILPPNTRVTDHFISLTDIYRTVCTLSGVTVPDDQALDSFDYSRLLVAPTEQLHGPLRDLLAIQAPVLADSATPNKKRMGWALYSYDPEGKIVNAVMSKSKSPEDFKDVTVDELYLLTDDEDQSEDIRGSNKKLTDSLELELTTFLNKDATHSGQLVMPEKAINWWDIVRDKE